MRISGCLIVLSLLPLLARGNVYGFGSSESIANGHPEFFERGRVTIVTNGCTPYYVCNGMARTIPFDRPQMKTIAQLRAEGALAKSVKGKRNGEVEIRGMLQIGKKTTSSGVVYVFAAPVSKVTFIPERSAPPVVTSTTTNIVTNVIAHISVTNLSNISKGACTNSCSTAENTDLLDLVDRAEHSPKDFSLRIKLVRAYCQRGCRDEAATECLWLLDAMVSHSGEIETKANWDYAIEVSEIISIPFVHCDPEWHASISIPFVHCDPEWHASLALRLVA